MHILILPMYYPEPGAPAHRGYMFYEQAMQIAKAGCKTGLAYVEQRLPKELTWKTFVRENHFQVSQEDNGTFVTLRMHAWNPKLSTRLGGKIWAYLTLRLTGIYIRRYGRPDVIHAHFGTWAGYAARLAYHKYGIPYVVTEHASSINAGNVTREQAAILRTAYSDAKRVVCVGSLLKKSLTPYLRSPEQAVVIPNFVDIGTFRFSTRDPETPRPFTFVSVGNLNKRKGFGELTEAFSRTFKSRREVRLAIVGDGEEENSLKEQIRQSGMDGQIRLTGRLSREKVADILAESDAFVLASHAETFGIVFIEAMATGMPAVGTVCGGPEDIITPECGYLIQPGDVSALADSMLQLYEHYHTFNQKHIRQSIAERFDFRLAGKRLLEIYTTKKNTNR